MIGNKLDSVPIPPPLPPPLPPLLPQIRSSIHQDVNHGHEVEGNWEDDLKRSFNRINHELKYTGFYVYNHVGSIIQRGPTCGLVALVMASRILGHELSVDQALKVGRENKFSTHGEMFSAQQMKELTEKMINVQVTLLHDMKCHKSTIVDHLVSGWPLLVPYDCDANHEPTTRGGHRAHWAVILGFCILETSESQKIDLRESQKKDLRESQKKDLRESRTSFKASSHDLQSMLQKCPDSLLMVLAKQGKSKYIKWWPFDQLCHSNRGLDRVDPRIEVSDAVSDFVLPENGDLRGSLANQFLMIQPK